MHSLVIASIQNGRSDLDRTRHMYEITRTVLREKKNIRENALKLLLEFIKDPPRSK